MAKKAKVKTEKVEVAADSAIDPLRHLSVFDPAVFGSQQIDVIGVGATGSRIALQLVKLGVSNIHLWDFDKVEAHNIANQMFSQKDIGKPKVEALAEILSAHAGIVPTIHNERVNGSQKLGDVVFLLTDTMSSRKEIWNGALKMKLSTKLVVETRMGVDEGRIYAFNPMLPSNNKAFEATLYDDEKVVEQSACGSTITVGPTADVVAGLAVWAFVKWFNLGQKKADAAELENEILFALRPPTFITRKFKEF